MLYSLPKEDKKAIPFTHFPTKHQALIFRAYEFFDAKRLAKILDTTEENVKNAAKDLGLPEFPFRDRWQSHGYITIIRRLWHVLPYNQLLDLLDMTEQEFALILKEEDFLDVKLSLKPICEPVRFRELTEDEKVRTAEIKKVVEKINFFGEEPFTFKYNIPKIKFSGKEKIETRMIYAFSSLYQNAFEVDSSTYCPDEMLEAYSKLGINGLWTQGVLSMLTEFPFDPEVSKGYEERLKKVRDFAKRLKKYGMKLYLYINEPRYMPKKFFENREHIKGHEQEDGQVCLCTSTKPVRDYLENGIRAICKAVPEIGGFFAIIRNENLTNCYSRSSIWGIECNCPRCKERSVGEVLGEVVKCICDGAHSVDPQIKVFAWSWSWDAQAEEIIKSLPKDAILLSQSELDIPFKIGGIKGNIEDYSMSILGPGERAKNEWKIAKECGLETAAKVQINTTWEASTVPALPVQPSVDKHIKDLSDLGIKHLLLSWTLGGYPSRNIATAAKYFYENCEIESESPEILLANKQFATAFSEFPFNVHVLYKGPQNAGPSNLLFEKPTGYTATMTCFPYDDVESWRAIYPLEVYENQLKKLCEGWQKGLDILKGVDENETVIMANATYCLFSSSLNQVKFIRARDSKDYKSMVKFAESELDIASKMLDLMNKNSSIGFEAANHYYFCKSQLAEKMVNCKYIIDKYTDKF